MMFVFYCLTSLSIIISRSIHVAANSIILFFFMAEQYSIVYMYHFFFIHSSVDRHLACFHVLAIVNCAAVGTGVHVSFQIMVFSGQMPRNGIAGSDGTSIFSFLRNFNIIFHSGCTNLHSHNSIGSFPFLHTPFSIYCLQFCFFFLMVAILISVR